MLGNNLSNRESDETDESDSDASSRTGQAIRDESWFHRNSRLVIKKHQKKKGERREKEKEARLEDARLEIQLKKKPPNLPKRQLVELNDGWAAATRWTGFRVDISWAERKREQAASQSRVSH